VIALGFAKSDAEVPKALLRFSNANPTFAALDLRLGEELLFSRVPYRRTSGYREVPFDRRRFSLRFPGSLRDRASTRLDLWNGHRYTVIAVAGPDGKPWLRAFKDDLAVPATGRPRLRFVHAATNSGPLTIRIPRHRADPIQLAVLDFAQGTSFLQVNPVTAAIEVEPLLPDPSGSASEPSLPPVRLDNLDLQPDRFYTFVISHRGGPGAGFIVSRIEDPLSGPGVESSRLPQYRPTLFPGVGSRTALQLLASPQEGFRMLEVISWIIFGLIVGVLAKLLVPGRDPGGIFITILLGIAGALLGGWVGRLMGIYGPGQVGGWIMSILGAVIILLLYRALRGRPRASV
jgi:uncharacterized membrane protein YeaQ/YmgE (transglycosylase-associated protein family)